MILNLKVGKRQRVCISGHTEQQAIIIISTGQNIYQSMTIKETGRDI